MKPVPFRRRAGHDDGTVLTLAVGGVILVLATVLALADASSLFMRHTALVMVADNAAIAAANAIDVAAIYSGGVGTTMTLNAALAAVLAEQSVSGVDDPRLRDVRLDSVSVDADVVTVIVSAAVPNPLAAITGTRNVRIRATAHASTPTRF